jgi:hypothetical protein
MLGSTQRSIGRGRWFADGRCRVGRILAERAFLMYAEYERLSVRNAKTEEGPVHRKIIITDLGDKTSNAYGRS